MLFSIARFPFPVSATTLVDETEADLINLPELLANTDRKFDPAGTKRSSSELKNILTLRPGHLVCWRMESTDTVFFEQDFSVVPVSAGAETVDIPDDSDNVIFMFMPDFVWNPIDAWDGYRLARYEGYVELEIERTPSTDFTPIYLLCVDLSYRYGVKFMFWEQSFEKGKSTFIVTMDKDFASRNDVWEELKGQCENFKAYASYIKSVKVYIDGPKFNKTAKPLIPDNEDFE